MAHITPGHTRGCTTWTMRVRDAAALRDVVFFCSPSVPDEYKLIGNAKYPDVVDDYRKQFATLKQLKCDVPLGSQLLLIRSEARATAARRKTSLNVKLLFVQDAMHEGHGDRSLANGGCDALDVAAADVADREDTWKARLQQIGRAGERPLRGGKILGR